jgi:hypothetical protein
MHFQTKNILKNNIYQCYNTLLEQRKAKRVNKRGLISILRFDHQRQSKGRFQHASCKHEKPNSL